MKTIVFDLHFKPTFSRRYLNYHSHHPISHKKGVILSLTDKVLNLSDPKFQQKNFELIISILLENSYPLEFIFSTINNRIKSHLHSNKTSSGVLKENDKQFFLIPYLKGISEQFQSKLNKYNFRAAYCCTNRLNKFIKTGKDSVDPAQQCGVVYRIACIDCDASYVGQTKRKLNTRVLEHKRDINKRSGPPSVISEHRSQLHHNFDWDHIRVLDRESFYQKRLVSEMLHIKHQSNSINKQNDTELFPDIYLPILSLFLSS